MQKPKDKYREEPQKGFLGIFLFIAVHSTALLTVSNTADNVRAEDMPKLFARFCRASQARDSQKKGFGLGLSITDGIIKSHKSKISAKLESNVLHISVTLK